MDLREFLCEHRATLSELCEPYVMNLRDEFNALAPEFRDELLDEFQEMCKLEIAEYISFYLGIDYMEIQETLEDVDIFTYLDMSV